MQRTVFSLIALAALVATAPAPTVLIPGHIDLQRGPDGNSVIIDGPDGTVVVDTGRHPEHAAAVIERAKAGAGPVVAIINTHWHLDHTTGNRDVLNAFPQATVIASHAVEGALTGFLARSRIDSEKALADGRINPDERRRIERALAAMADRAALVPGLAVERDISIAPAGRRIAVHLAPRAATEGDVWLVVPDEKLAVVGDLVVAPIPFFDTGCEQGWAQALDAIAKARWRRLIPGHGAPMTRADFNRWRAAFKGYVDCAHSPRATADCASGWMRDAAGFYTPAEAASVRAMAVYYVNEVLRAPVSRRMAYCQA